MKNIKFITLLFAFLAIGQFAFAQGTEDNGRSEGAVPGPVVETPAPPPVAMTGDDDRDIPGEPKEEPADYYYPLDMDLINDDLVGISPVEMAQKINELTELVDALQMSYEELRLENQVIRQSFSSCCSSASLGLNARDAYLVQNAPNPFNESAEIRYFVPNGMQNVEIRISDVKGEVVKKHAVKEAGYGTLKVEADPFANGTYVYMLVIDGEVIDSKVMIITANN